MKVPKLSATQLDKQHGFLWSSELIFSSDLHKSSAPMFTPPWKIAADPRKKKHPKLSKNYEV